MRRFGPNDGMTPITDAIAPGGRTVVALGKDHFFTYEPEELEIKTLTMIRVLLDAVGEKRRIVAGSGAEASPVLP
jgi:hypothetical protein